VFALFSIFMVSDCNAKTRVGSIALGYVLDRLYPPVAPSAPYCPCCRDSVQDTWGHHLSGECKATASLYEELSPTLEQLMKEVAPGWGGQVLGCIHELSVGGADLGSTR
jgi:hypothetical protein